MRYQKDVPRIILAYLLSKGFVILPRSSKEEHIANNISMERIKLSAEDILRIDELSKGDHPLKVCWDSKDVI